jgi:hypothetical protein
MPMTCPDCEQDLNDVSPSDPCPQCGGTRRNALVRGQAALVGVSALAGTVKVGYTLDPGWTYQWRSIQRHLARLHEQYAGIDTRGNVDVEETVHALFLALYHFYDWLYQDSSISLTEQTVRTFINNHPNSLSLCRDYANTRKHMTRNQPGALIAQITSIEAGPHGYAVTIGYRPWDQPAAPTTEIDALALAEQCERDWRDLLTSNGIQIPS